MTLRLRKPSIDELVNLLMYHLTSDGTWHTKNHNDTSFTIVPLGQDQTERIDPQDAADNNQLNVDCQLQDVDDEDHLMVDEVDGIADKGELLQEVNTDEARTTSNILADNHTSDNKMALDNSHRTFDPGGIEKQNNDNSHQPITLQIDYSVFSPDSEVCLLYTSPSPRDRG